MNTKESFSDSIYKGQMQMAEREFSAFISAVKELLGPEQPSFRQSTGSTSWNSWTASPDLQADIGGWSRSRPRRDLQID